MEGVDKSQKISNEGKNNAKDDIHKIDDNVKSSKVNNKATTNVIIMQRNDLQSEKKTFCSDDVKKHVSLLFILIFFILMLSSFGVFLVITFTNIFNENIVENLVLKNGTKSLEWWIDSPLEPLLKVHIFNYTNIEAVLDGKEKKIKVEDVGPYVYKEKVKRVNLTYLDDFKITSYEDRIQYFSRKDTPDKYNEDDMVMVPNMPLILAINKVEKDSTKKLMLSGLITMTSPKEFQMKSVKDYLFGYTDPFVNGIAVSMTDFRPEKIGIIGSRKGISTDNLTIYTGEDSLENLGKIHAMNEEAKMNIWASEECNEIVGTDGSQFPPSWMDGERNLEVFIKSICRPFPLKYESEVTVLNGLPAWRYRPVPNVFGSSLVNPDNTCYCDASDPKNKCPPSGVFDSDKCAGVSILMSYPHFYEGDEILIEPFEGLSPNAEDHATFADIHPRMAFPIGGASRLQINLRVKKMKYGLFNYNTAFNNLPEDLIIPICWFELTAGEISPELMALIFNTTHSANTAYLTIQYGSIICMFVSFLLILSTAFFYYRQLAGKSTKSKYVEEANGGGSCGSKDVVLMVKTQQHTESVYPTLPSQNNNNNNNEV